MQATVKNWWHAMKAQDKIAEDCMFAIGPEWQMIW